MLITIFYYFGWDVASNLAEETANAKKAAGLGGVVGVFVIVACSFWRKSPSRWL